MMKKIALLATALLLTACAKGPDAITPMSMPVNAYSGLSCNQLAAEHQKSTTALNAVSAQQRQAQTGDAVGVFLIGVPMSSLTGGDKEGAVAQHKGEVIAISSAQRNKGC
jgi:starvation-inducible outer membrane lipoprotein